MKFLLAVCKYEHFALHIIIWDIRPIPTIRNTVRIIPHNSFGSSMGYSRTSEQRTLWERVYCPFFGGCPYLGGSPYYEFISSSKMLNMHVCED